MQGLTKEKVREAATVKDRAFATSGGVRLHYVVPVPQSSPLPDAPCRQRSAGLRSTFSAGFNTVVESFLQKAFLGSGKVGE
jgi:hypothetical protein